MRSDFRLVMCEISENVQTTSKECLKNEQECTLSGLKTRGEAQELLKLITHDCEFLELVCFKIADIDQIILALIFRFGVILV